MCTCVFVGSTKPIPRGPIGACKLIAIQDVEVVPPALAGCADVAHLVSSNGSLPSCSCVFVEDSLPWESVEESEETVIAFNALRALAKDHGTSLKIFGCDDVDAYQAPNVWCRVAQQHIHAGMILFSIPFNGGNPPRVFVEIDPDLKNPEKPETLGVL